VHVDAVLLSTPRPRADLWEAVKKEFPPPPPPPSELAYERSFHQHCIDDRVRGFIGRNSLITELMRFADDDVGRESLPLVLLGGAGTGKTSLVAALAKRYAATRPAVFTLVHMVSASPSSTDVSEVR